MEDLEKLDSYIPYQEFDRKEIEVVPGKHYQCWIGYIFKWKNTNMKISLRINGVNTPYFEVQHEKNFKPEFEFNRWGVAKINKDYSLQIKPEGGKFIDGFEHYFGRFIIKKPTSI
jgi:hypothetical protein